MDIKNTNLYNELVKRKSGYTVCSFREEVAEICQAHTMEVDYTVKRLRNKDIKGKNRLSAQ